MVTVALEIRCAAVAFNANYILVIQLSCCLLTLICETVQSCHSVPIPALV